MTPSVSVLTGFWLRFHFSNVKYFFQELNSKKLLSKFRKRKRKSPSFVHVLHKTWNWEVSRRNRTTIDGNLKWTKLLFCQSILPFSLPPPSSLLKLSDVFLKRPLKKVLWKLRSPRGYFRKFSLSAGVKNSGNVFQSNVSFLFLFLLGIWYSPSQPFFGCHATLFEGALRDIPKTAAGETRDLAAVCIFGHALKNDRRSHWSLLLEHVFPEVIKPSCNRAHQALS